MPKSLWVAVVMIGYLLARLSLLLILSFRNLMNLHLGEETLENFVEDVSAWDKFFASLFLVVTGVLIIRGLLKGNKPAWFFANVFAVIGAVLTIGGYLSGWLHGGQPTLHSAFVLFLYLIPALTIATTLNFPSARAYCDHKILWKPFLIQVGMGVVIVIFWAVAWSLWSFHLYDIHHPRTDQVQSVPKP